MKVANSQGTRKHKGSSKEKLNPKKMHRDFLDRMEDQLQREGVVFFDTEHGLNIDDEFLELPREITEITSRDLGEYLNAFTQQKVYLRTILGRAELVEEENKRIYFDVANRYYKEYASHKLSETAKDRLINSNDEVRPLYDDYMDAKKKVSIIRYAIENVEDICFLISREVTRRNGDFEGEMRASNVKYRR